MQKDHRFNHPSVVCKARQGGTAISFQETAEKGTAIEPKCEFHDVTESKDLRPGGFHSAGAPTHEFRWVKS